MVVYESYIDDKLLKFQTAAGAKKDISERNMSFFYAFL